VFFGFDRQNVRHSLDGFGFIVPPGEGGVLAGTWVSSKWSGRAPPGTVLVRAFVGGARDPDRVASSTDEELLAFAKAELERLMGPMRNPRLARVYRYENANPQPLVGHLDVVRGLRARCAARLPGLFLAGAAYDGVGIPDCVRQARAAARDLVNALPVHAEARAT
jgi:oxygen-dependent protoporphyrinogen oxidase